MRQLTAKDYVALPWKWDGPTQCSDGSGATWYEVRVAELPDFLVAGATQEEVLADVAEALEAFIASYLDRGENPPLPDLVLAAGGTAALTPFKIDRPAVAA